jgi:uncharacterized membrane protein
MSSTAFGDQLSLEPTTPAARIRPRLDSVDLLRGLVMVIAPTFVFLAGEPEHSSKGLAGEAGTSWRASW